MTTDLNALQEVKDFIELKDITVIVFSTHSCNVCKPLIAKIDRVLQGYETIGFANVHIEDIKEVQGEYQVFTAPIVLLFVEGKEIKRYSAAMDILDFHKTIDRYHDLVSRSDIADDETLAAETLDEIFREQALFDTRMGRG